MVKNNKLRLTLILSVIFIFGAFVVAESTAWARAGGGRSFGSRGSKSFSAPSSPSSRSSSSPGFGTPGRAQSPNQPSSGGFFSRSPLLQGMAGGLAGGLLGSMLFGGSGHASPGGGVGGGGGMGLMDILILGLLAYFGWKFFQRRRLQREASSGYYSEATPSRLDSYSSYPQTGASSYPELPRQSGFEPDELQRGIEQIRSYDPSFHEENFRETAQDLFFRIQAGWMNRDLDAIGSLLASEMTDHFRGEFESMKQKGVFNRLENIAVRKVELAEAWQETGKDYVTVLITANLLDYTVDEASGRVVEGDKLNPVKFQEFWSFCRDVGTQKWRLSAINQPEKTIARYN